MRVRTTTALGTAVLALGLTGCGGSTPDRATAPSTAPSPSSAGTSSAPGGDFTLRANSDPCAAFDLGARGALGVSTPTASPGAGSSSSPICVFPGADPSRGPIAVQVQPGLSLDTWTQFADNVIPLEVDGLPAASAQLVKGLGCALGVELGGGVVSLSRSGTATDCSDLAPAAGYAVAGIRAAG